MILATFRLNEYIGINTEVGGYTRHLYPLPFSSLGIFYPGDIYEGVVLSATAVYFHHRNLGVRRCP
jgi:hypothetical protein